MSLRLKRCVKWVFYTVQLVVLFGIQQSIGFTPAIFGGRPNLILALLITVSVKEKKFAPMVFGALVGVLLDMSNGYSLGFGLILMSTLGFLISFINRRYLLSNTFAATILAFVFVPLTLMLIAFNSSNWNFIEFFSTMFSICLSSILYTIISVPIVFLFNKSIDFLKRK